MPSIATIFSALEDRRTGDRLPHRRRVPPIRRTFSGSRSTLTFLRSRRCRSGVPRHGASGVTFPGVERRLFQRRRALHARHRFERVCACASGLSLPASWHPTSRPMCSKRPAAEFTQMKSRRPVRAFCSGSIFCAAAIRAFARVKVVPELRSLIEFRRLNFMDADYGSAEQVGCHLFPQRHHLLRPRNTGEDLVETLRAAAPGGYLFVGHSETLHNMGFRWSLWHRRSTGGSMMDTEDELAEVYVQPGESHLTTAPVDYPHSSWVVCRSRVSGSAAGRRRVVPSDVAALSGRGQAAKADPRRYVDYAIRELAQRFDALGIAAHERRVKLFGGADVLQFRAAAGRPRWAAELRSRARCVAGRRIRSGSFEPGRKPGTESAFQYAHGRGPGATSAN